MLVLVITARFDFLFVYEFKDICTLIDEFLKDDIYEFVEDHILPKFPELS